MSEEPTMLSRVVQAHADEADRWQFVGGTSYGFFALRGPKLHPVNEPLVDVGAAIERFDLGQDETVAKRRFGDLAAIAIARAGILAMREPTETMKSAECNYIMAHWSCPTCGGAQDSWPLMIDEAAK